MTTKHVVQRSRQQLKAIESHAEASIRAAHTHMLASLKPTLDALYADIEAEQQRHEDGKIPLAWLYQDGRLDALKRAVTGQVNHFATTAHTTVQHVEQQAKALGTQTGREQAHEAKKGK